MRDRGILQRRLGLLELALVGGELIVEELLRGAALADVCGDQVVHEAVDGPLGEAARTAPGCSSGPRP